MRVCYFGTYKPSYPRNRIVIDGLRANGVEVVECNVPLWGSTAERVSLAEGGWRNGRFLLRLGRAYRALIRAERALGAYDVMLVGYPGQLDMYLARILSWRRRKPLVFDVLMSLHLIFEERGIAEAHPLTAQLVFWVEQVACKMADLVILDTKPYRDYFCRKYDLSPLDFRLAPLGADERVYYPLDPDTMASKEYFSVAYHGQFVPLHGVAHIIEAARLLRDQQAIHFEFIGEGTTKQTAMAMAARYALSNVTFTGWLNKEELSRHLAGADICLGIFGGSPQALFTVPNKIWEGLAMRKAVITANTPAVRDVLSHRQHLYLCDPEDPMSLAEAIQDLYENPALCERLARQGYAYCHEHFTMEETGRRVKQYLTELMAQREA
jgi:glycosyltransferase involved in cell wall biosynthesis